MAVTLIHAGRRPGQSQFGLDNFTESYKTNSLATDVLTDGSVPQKGDAHPVFPFMFVTDRHVAETGPSASALDLVYQGVMNSSGGDPILPFAQHRDDTQVQSASSSRSNAGKILTSPLTVQYYSPSTEKTFITYGGKATSGFADDPTDDIAPITVTIGDTSYIPEGILSTVIADFFSIQIVATLEAVEVVSGQFWNNVSKKVKTLFPFLFTTTPGEYIVMFAPGSGYSVSDSLTMTDGTFTAVIIVASVGIGGSVVGYTISSNTFNYTTPAPIATSGGAGSGAAFYNYHIS